ncbi:MAG: Sec-independent protein translocase protein TatB [Acidimicrobiales bacterium]
MFNVGGGELLVILMIALIVLGPTRLPDAARTIGKTMGELRRLSTSFQSEVRSALDTADDPTQVATRRNVLGGDDTPPPAADRPRRRTPLVAAPEPTGTTGTTPSERATTKPAQRTSTAATKPAAAKKAAPKNGTAVQKPAPSKAPARRTKPS